MGLIHLSTNYWVDCVCNEDVTEPFCKSGCFDKWMMCFIACFILIDLKCV